MSRRKGLIWFVASFMLISSFLTACSKSGNDAQSSPSAAATVKPTDNKPATPIQLKVTALKRPEVTKKYSDLDMVKKLMEGSNVQVDWSLVTADNWGEQKNLMFASGDMPDALYGGNVLNSQEIVKYGSQGLLVPLEKLIPLYAPNFNKILQKRPEYKKAITAPDGHIYALPVIDESKHRDVSDALFINKKWLDEAGLGLPQTTDDFYNALKAFKQKDPNRIPFSFMFGNLTYGINSMFGSFGILDSPSHITIQNGNVVFAPIQPGYKDGIQYFRKLFAEGLIDPESFTQAFNVYSAKIKDPKSLGSAVYWSTFQNFPELSKSPLVPISPLKGPNGTQLWNRQLTNILAFCGFAITTANKHPEETLRWIDKSFEEDMSLQMLGGPFGVTQQLLADGKLKPIPVPQGQIYAEWRHQYTPGDQSLYASLQEYGERQTETTVGVQNKLDQLPLYAPYLPSVENTYPVMLFSSEEVQKLSDISSDLNKFVSQTITNWIVKGGVEQEWDNYIKQLKQLGLDQYVKIYTDAFNRYKKS
ncbi:extracellular solute-binding protein [Paenibacillus koleovorans]|uniref:extracellular solute-binding protein n=1 Tax=Paenibacillus koleovorans TaxID=121608 RepID=UPI000FDB43C9|nr:extracellular solute-binding protein [Paenibacillus koleovorans]